MFKRTKPSKAANTAASTNQTTQEFLPLKDIPCNPDVLVLPEEGEIKIRAPEGKIL